MIEEGNPTTQKRRSRRKITSQLFTFSVGKENYSINSKVPEKHNHNVQGSSVLGFKRNPLCQLSQTYSSKGLDWFPRNEEGTSASRVNLMDAFNDASDVVLEDMLEYEQYVTDDELDAMEHQGEDLSDCNDEYIDEDLDFWKGYMHLGPPSKICGKCKSRMWNEERNNKSNKNSAPTFSICCKNGQVELTKERPPPHFLYYFLSGGEKTAHFLKNIRTYNSLFQFTSLGGKIDRKINNGGGPYCFKLNGQNYHLIGNLKPKEGQSPKFAQLYVYDTDNEIQNQMGAVPGSDGLDPEIVEGLLKMLDENNKLSEGFCYACDRLNILDTDDFSLILVSLKSTSGRKNQVGPSNEVAVLIIGDNDDTCPFRDIVVETKQNFLKRVYETCKHFMSLQFPLLFSYGDDRFHLNILLKNKKQNVPAEAVNDLHPYKTKHRTTITMREYYAYKLMICPDEGMNLHIGGRLWQQFVVDTFSAVEQYRLDWIRNHQSTIRSDLYRSIRDSLTKGDTNPENIGKNVILPATHTGSQRYNANTFFDDCGFPVYRRRRIEASVLKKGVLLDNQYVVPYNRDLLLRFHCHINLKVCNSSRSLEYLFKYCLKGYDTATMLLRKKNKKDTPDETTTKAKSTD
ncbi:uncharacterized protein LOC141690817 [Apium graveolens]|uniref:uncharacterized protein LOC141690817 n=1 Tax=Apium graveolens TaxID=4045 RepID=UPI003D78F9AC